MKDGLKTYEGLCAVASMRARLDAADWKEIVMEIAAAPKSQRVRAMRQAAARTGRGFGTVRRKFYEYERDGDAALVDRRRVKATAAANPWAECYMTYVERDRNTSMGGYRQMMGDFRAGRPMVGAIGTWVDVFRREFPGVPVPASCPADWTPRGATYANLQAAAKSNPDYFFSIAANRQGRKAAHRFLAPVLTTRVGLPVGAKVEYDDVWHNADVMLGARACQALEFAGYDVASGYKCSSILKPRFARADGARDNLKEQQFRFLFAYDHIVRGFHRGGVEDVVEHGTTAIREGVERQIRAIPVYGGLIRIARSGVLSEQVHAGLFIGNGGGNFRMKALCEGSHNILHNRTASLVGSRGRDAEHLHESQAALVRYEERLVAAAASLPPEFALKLEAGLLTFDEYHAAFRRIEAQLMDDPEHRLEGWGANVVAEYRLGEQSNDWRPWAEVERLAAGDEGDRLEAFAIAKLVARRPSLKRVRPMSRREAWMAGQGDLVRVDEWYLPHFLDAGKDALRLTVRDNGLMGFRNELYYGRDEMLYRAVVRNRAGWEQALAPGTRAMALFNPMMPEKVWLLDAGDGHTLGTCALHNRAPAYDRRAIEAAMGEQARDLARKVLPVRGRHQDEAERRARRMAANLRVLAAAKEAAARGPAPDGEGYALDDLNGAAIREDPADGAAGDGENADALAFLDAANAV